MHARCRTCGSPRIAYRHPELTDLTIAHIDCDAFYASVEKRDNPDLANKPVIIGGGKARGRINCLLYRANSAVFIRRSRCSRHLKPALMQWWFKPNMEKYAEAGRSDKRDDARADTDGRTIVDRRSLFWI